MQKGKGMKWFALFVGIMLVLALLPGSVLAQEREVDEGQEQVAYTASAAYDVTSIELNVVEISMYLALDDDGNVWEWGNYGGIKQIELPGKAISIATYGNNRVSLLENGDVYIWEKLENSNFTIPYRIDLPAIKQIAASISANILFLTEEGNIWGLGQNSLGELGLGHTNTIDEPTLCPFLQNITELHLFNSSSWMAINQNGERYVWGRNFGNRLLVKDYKGLTYQSIPTTAHDIPEFQALRGGANSLNLITPNNQLLVWGVNSFGILGLGNYTDKYYTPTLNTESDPFIATSNIFAGFIVKSDGSVWSTGKNDKGLLGSSYEDTSFYRNTFEQIASLSDIVDLQAVSYSVYAQNMSGDWYAWGLNHIGQLLPNGENYEYVNEPVLIFTAKQSKPEPEPGHTVSITTHYDDGILPDTTDTYTVPYGAAFCEQFDVLEGYSLDGVRARAIPLYDLDMVNKTVSITSVEQDIHITLEFTPIIYTVKVVTMFADGSSNDVVQTYKVPYGQFFETGFTVPDGYGIDDVQFDVLGIYVSKSKQTIEIDEVKQNATITITVAPM